METGEGLVFENAIKGGVIPGGFIPAVEKGVAEAMQHGELAGYPIKDVRVRLFDGSHHTVDSSEMAFKICGSMAFKEAMAKADPALLEPIVQLEISVPEDVGRRRDRRPQLAPRPSARAWSRSPAITRIDAEVPMAEVLDYAPRPARDHGRPRRVHDRVRALRGAAGPPRRAGGRRRRRGRAPGELSGRSHGAAWQCAPAAPGRA